MSDLVDWRPVLKGAGIAAAIAVLIGLSLGLVADTSNYGFAAFALIMAGMGVGGFVGARPQTDVAFTAGAASSFLASLVAQSLSLAVQLAKGTDLPAGYLFGAVFTLLISTSFGVLGGYVALRRARPARPAAEEAPT
jgi:hypothetical protein